jgi:predicted RNase H-like nuclease (RuvC/YqgF family)
VPALSSILLQLRPSTGTEDRIGEIIIVFLGLTIAAAAWAVTERRRRRELESQLTRIAQTPPPVQLSERDAEMFEQHKKMNELQIQKLAAEVEMLKAQNHSGFDIADRHEASKEYHELMVEKTRLEMDALRLQIAEHRRRAEDWRSED